MSEYFFIRESGADGKNAFMCYVENMLGESQALCGNSQR